MIEYIYFVKCPNCEDEPFSFFEEAKEFALGCLSQKPIITQIEVDRNDFGECRNSADLGTVWSWEDMMNSRTYDGPAISMFTKDGLKRVANWQDPEFANIDNSLDFEIEKVSSTDAIKEELKLATNANGDYLVKASSGHGYTVFNRSDVAIGGFGGDDDAFAVRRFEVGDINESKKPVIDGKTIKELVEEMEEREDTVECAGCEELFDKADCVYKDGIGWLCSDCEDTVVKCTWCEELFDRSECRYEVDMGWLCDRCEAAIKSRGETLTFREGSYWDFLDEKLDLDIDFSQVIDSSDMEIWGVESTGEDTYKAVLLKRFENVPFRGGRDEIEKVESEMFDLGGLFVFHFGKDGLPKLGRWDPELLNSLGNCEIIFDDARYDQAVEETLNGTASKREALDPEALHDLGNEYDGGYPADSELEDTDTYLARLVLCPECGKTALDPELSMCSNCGAIFFDEEPNEASDEAESLEEATNAFSNEDGLLSSLQRIVGDYVCGEEFTNEHGSGITVVGKVPNDFTALKIIRVNRGSSGREYRFLLADDLPEGAGVSNAFKKKLLALQKFCIKNFFEKQKRFLPEFKLDMLNTIDGNKAVWLSITLTPTGDYVA